MMSPSDLLATPSSECLHERCSRHRHWETYDDKTNIRKLTEQHASSAIQHQLTRKTQRKLKTGLGIFRSQGKSAPNRFTRHIPPFKLTLDLWTQPCRPFESNEWTSSWQRWPTILSFVQRTNSDAFGTLPRGIPAGTHSSPWSGRTLAGQMPLYPSLGHSDQWVTRTECGP